MFHARFASVVFMLAGTSLASAGSLAHSPAPAGPPPANPIEGVVQTVVAQYQAQASFPVPGIAVAVVYKGKTYSYYTGVQDLTTNLPVTNETLFELGSVTKTFTAIELAHAYLDRRLQAQIWRKGAVVTDINLLGRGNQNPGKTFVNGDPCPTATVAPIPPSAYGVVTEMTLEELATHTSTLPTMPQNPFASPTPGPQIPLNDRPCYSPQRLMNFVEGYTPTPPPVPPPVPGQAYVYSDIGFGTLGYALAGIYQKPWYELTHDVIVDPLDMRHTWDLQHIPKTETPFYATPYSASNVVTIQWPLDAWPAAGALRSTMPDMARYLRACLLLDGPRSLRAAADFTEQPFFLLKPPSVFQDLAWTTYYNGTPYRITYKDGGTAGFSSWVGLTFPPQQGIRSPIGVVVLTNQGPPAESLNKPAPAPVLGQAILVGVAALGTQR